MTNPLMRGVTKGFNLIHSFGCELHYAEANIGRTTRMSRYERLSTDGGQLDGSGIDPAPEVPVRTDVDATTEIYAKTIVINREFVDLKPLVIDLELLAA